MRYNGLETSSACDTTNSFAKYFESVYSCDLAQPPTLDYASPLDTSAATVSIGEAFRKFVALNINKGPGHDDLPPGLFRSLPFIKSTFLWIFFYTSLPTGKFPATWKSSVITPFFKFVDKSNMADYGPISILNMPKMFDDVIDGKL